MRIDVIATGIITGPEARGDVTFTRNGEGGVTVRISNVWIAPVAPDVRIYLSSDPEGDFRSGTMTELGKVTELAGELSYDYLPSSSHQTCALWSCTAASIR